MSHAYALARSALVFVFMGAAVNLSLASLSLAHDSRNATLRHRHRLPPVRWDSVVDAAVHPLEENDYPVTLTASTDLPEMTILVGPRLQPFVAVDRTKIGPLKRGQTATITVSVSAGIDQKETSVSGFLVLAISNPRLPWKLPLPNPLLVKVRVSCPCYPPDPGSAGKITLAGIDSDQDGVRDDVQRSIATTYPASERTRESIAQFAKSLQLEVTAVTPQQAETSFRATEKSVDCLSFVNGQSHSELIRWTLAQTLNTDARTRAFMDYEALPKPTPGRIVPRSQRRAACDFPVESLPD
jgi:hypothetical protein